MQNWFDVKFSRRKLSKEKFEVNNVAKTFLWWYEFHRFEIFKCRIDSLLGSFFNSWIARMRKSEL